MAKKKATPATPAPEMVPYIAEGLRSLAVSIDELTLDPANARKHPEANLEAIKASLKVYGQRKPIVVNKRNGVIEAGNGTLEAAKELGWSHLAALFVDDDPTTATGFAIADNRTAELAIWDNDALSKLLAEDLTDDPELVKVFEELKKSIPEGSGRGEDEELDAGDEDEDALDLLFKAPFPWFGGKSRVARLVWQRFGNIPSYIEPFFGSGAVLLNRPPPFEGTETVNDFDGLISNFWRALQAKPKEVAKYADWPSNENDMNARHMWLVERKQTLQAKLEGDPDYYDVKTAGWWCWGIALWIGGGFCRGDGPWGIEEIDGVRQLVHLSDQGQGVNRQLVHLSSQGRGVKRKLVHLSDQGQGVNRKRVADDETEGNAGLGERGLYAWMEALAERIKRVRVCCGDWTRICGGDSGNAISHFFAAGDICGIFLDPPYADTADRDANVYNKDDLEVAHKVREWCVLHGDDPRLRIALCGYEGEHAPLIGWDCVKWKAHGGMSTLAKGESKGKVNKFRERIWFSPHCLKPEQKATLAN